MISIERNKTRTRFQLNDWEKKCKLYKKTFFSFYHLSFCVCRQKIKKQEKILIDICKYIRQTCYNLTRGSFAHPLENILCAICFHPKRSRKNWVEVESGRVSDDLSFKYSLHIICHVDRANRRKTKSIEKLDKGNEKEKKRKRRLTGTKLGPTPTRPKTTDKNVFLRAKKRYLSIWFNIKQINK